MAFNFRPSNDAQEAIEQIKHRKNLKTNSKAVEYALVNFLESERQIKVLQDQTWALQSNIDMMIITVQDREKSDINYQDMLKRINKW